MKIKHKKSQGGGMWWLIAGAVAAIIATVILIAMFKGGLFNLQKNINLVDSCINRGGQCTTKEECGSDSTRFYKLGGCPDEPDEDRSGDGSESEENVYCCIPKEN